MLEFDYVDPDSFNLEYKILKPGPARFRVKGFREKDKNGEELTTQKGEKKLVLDLIMTDQDKNTGLVSDFFLASMPWKVKVFADAIGWPELYSKDASGKVKFDPETVIGMEGECELKTYNGTTTVVDKYHRAVMRNQNKHSFANEEEDGIPF